MPRIPNWSCGVAKQGCRINILSSDSDSTVSLACVKRVFVLVARTGCSEDLTAEINVMEGNG